MTITEVAPDIYRISTYVKDIDREGIATIAGS